MNKDKKRNLSTFMTKILRHSPQEFGILLDEEGYCELDDLLIAIGSQDYWNDVKFSDFEKIVEECKKQRFNIEGTKIRANYGHSYKRISYKEGTPPECLIHGTNEGVLDKIFKEGLKKMGREYVHLSEGEHFATLAGKRRGDVVLLTIDTTAARKEEVKFYYAGNEVWLADFIPAKFLEIRNK